VRNAIGGGTVPRMPTINPPPGFDVPTLLRLAASADADPRTVARVLRGERVRGRAGERIRQVLVTNGAQLESRGHDTRLKEIG
jgi:hypothetical protein